MLVNQELTSYLSVLIDNGCPHEGVPEWVAAMLEEDEANANP